MCLVEVYASCKPIINKTFFKKIINFWAPKTNGKKINDSRYNRSL